MATSKAPIRKLSSLNFVTIHHSGEEPTATNISELKTKAKKWDTYHATKDYDGDGTSDAQYTDGKFGYKWILYHYLVAKDGSILQVQDIKWRRFHATDSARGMNSHNEYGIAICLDGNYTQYKVRGVQKRAIAQIVFNLEKQLGKSLIVRTHKEQALGKAKNGTLLYPEKTGVFYTDCAGETMGTHKSGTCKEIIEMVNTMYTTPAPEPVPNAPTTPAISDNTQSGATMPIQNTATTETTTATTVKKTLLEIIIQFFTDLLQRIKSD